MATENTSRIVIAVTESCSVDALWQAAMQRSGDTAPEIVALYLSDDRWHRVAKLPFTREISKSGVSADFTAQRAEQVIRQFIDSAQRRLDKLANEANIAVTFKVLHARNEQLIDELLTAGLSAIIAPARIAAGPVYLKLEQLDCEIALVDD